MFAWIASWLAGKFGGMAGKLLEFIIAAALLIVLIGGPYWLGMRHQRASDTAAQAKAAMLQREALEQAVQQARSAQQLRDQAAVAANQTQQLHIKTRTQVLRKEVVRYVSTHPAVSACGLDADGVRLWRAANAGHSAATGAAGSAGGAVPAPADAGQRRAGRSAGQPRTNHGPVLPVQGPS